MVNSEGRPLIMNSFVALFVALLVVSLYAVLAPFTFVFKGEDEVAYTQYSVSVFANFERDAEGTVVSEVVYGEDAETFYYTVGEEKYVFGESNNRKLRVRMFLIAAKNLVTLKWADEDFVIELDS